MSESRIFCNVPWTNTHLYWDGTYGVCCSEQHRSTNTNIHNSSLVEWFNSTDMRNFRKRILNNDPLPECAGCYREEQHGHESRRIKENFKSVLFTTQAFDRSYKQSPWYDTFEQARLDGGTEQLPRDWHIDFGNECNLACKMCNPNASSRIAQHYKTWDINFTQSPNWTNNDKSWQQFLNNVRSVPNINRLHIMGGEPTISKRFYEFVCWLVDNNYHDVSISFVTNGTSINQDLFDKLQNFKSLDIEVSLESLTPQVNEYIRHGSDTVQVINNIKHLLSLQSGQFHVVLRNVPQLFNINTYHNYIQFAFDNKISIQSIPLIQPSYLAINVLPLSIRETMVGNYENVKQYIIDHGQIEFTTLATGRDTSRLSQQLIRECNTMISLLQQPDINNADLVRQELIVWLQRWDRMYNQNALEIYPEYQTFLESYGYTT